VTTNFDGAFQDALCALARSAGAAIMAVRRRGVVTASKSDDSPVTAADHLAQELILPGLHQLLPGVPVIAEEAPAEPWDERRQWRHCWLLDPLDGTREFIAGSPEFTVNIALVSDGVPVLGLILQPATGDLVAAFNGAGEGGGWLCFRAGGDGGRRPLPEVGCPPPGGGVRLVVSRHYGAAEAAALTAGLSARYGSISLREAGSAYKFCLLAQGAADIYPRRAPTCEWDTAAGQAILQALGGGVFDLAGKPLTYNRGPSLINPPFIALARGRESWGFLFAPGTPQHSQNSSSGRAGPPLSPSLE